MDSRKAQDLVLCYAMASIVTWSVQDSRSRPTHRALIAAAGSSYLVAGTHEIAGLNRLIKWVIGIFVTMELAIAARVLYLTPHDREAGRKTAASYVRPVDYPMDSDPFPMIRSWINTHSR